MKWILIIIVYHGGTGTTTATFDTKAACETAKDWVKSVSRYYQAECFPTEAR